MSRPINKHERFLVGKRKGQKRATGYWRYVREWKSPVSVKESDWKNKQACLRRDTTKLCSCVMCGNPRRLLKEITIQEKRYGT